jgi:two-component system OmpR family sensor kinase
VTARPLATFRGRLTTRWTAAFGVLLALANAAIYVSAHRYLHRDLDAKVRTVAATELASSTDRAEIHLHELPTEALGEGEYTGKFVQILEPDGRVRAESEQLRGRPALIGRDVLAQGLRGEAPLVDLTLDGRAARAAVLAASKNGESYAVVVGLYTDDVEQQLARLASLLAVIWGVGLAATAIIGYRLASAALAPVVAITRRAARIARGDFSARLDPPMVEDEVGHMSRSLNEVLDRLHAALEANRRFAADASHELRGPITAMAGEIDVTLKHSRSADEYREALTIVRERLSALTSLTEDLILLVRAQEGGTGTMLREVPLVPQLREAAARLAALARARAVRVDLVRMPDLVAYADPRLLARVLDNVLTNAVQYNRQGGRVAIDGEVEDAAPDEWKSGSLVLRVSDTGPGIDPALHERVFERFYRVDRSRARHTGGSGLGLAISREVLAVLGGTIRIARSDAAGTTFEIRMPGRAVSAERTTEALVPPAVTPSLTIH